MGFLAYLAGHSPRRMHWNDDDGSRSDGTPATVLELEDSFSKTTPIRRRPSSAGCLRACFSATSPLPPRSKACRPGSDSLHPRPKPRLPIVSASVQRRRQAPIVPPVLDTCNGVHRADVRLIPLGSPSDGAVPRLGIALARSLDLCGQPFRQPPACLDDESTDVRTRRDHRNLLQRTVNLGADELLRLSARTGRTLHKRRGDATHPRSPIYRRQANDLARRDALLVSRGNPHHVTPTRKRARADADELRSGTQGGIGLHGKLGLPLLAHSSPDAWNASPRRSHDS